VSTTADAVQALARAAAMLAAAGGVIHLAVIRHHLAYAAITAGFALMGVAQLVVALGLALAPAPRTRVTAAVLHASILAIWLVSRTVGLALVPGAEDPAAFGVADTIANLFGAGVLAALAAPMAAGRRASHTVFPPRTARRVGAVVAIAALALAVPAVLAPHSHAGHDHPGAGEMPVGPDHAPPGGDHHDHDHG
jgi:hypothetical protein